LTLLAPVIQEEILALSPTVVGRDAITERTLRPIVTWATLICRSLPISPRIVLSVTRPHFHPHEGVGEPKHQGDWSPGPHTAASVSSRSTLRRPRADPTFAVDASRPARTAL